MILVLLLLLLLLCLTQGWSGVLYPDWPWRGLHGRWGCQAVSCGCAASGPGATQAADWNSGHCGTVSSSAVER